MASTNEQKFGKDLQSIPEQPEGPLDNENVVDLSVARAERQAREAASLESARKKVETTPVHLVPPPKPERPLGYAKRKKPSFWSGIKAIWSKNKIEDRNLSKDEKKIEQGFNRISVLFGLSVHPEYYKDLDEKRYEKFGREPAMMRFYEDFYHKSILPAYREFFDPKQFIENEGYRRALHELAFYIHEVTNQKEEDIVQEKFQTSYKANHDTYRIVCLSSGNRVVDIKVFREEEDRDIYVFGSHIPLREYAGQPESIIQPTSEDYKNGFCRDSTLSTEYKRGDKTYDGSIGIEESKRFSDILDKLDDLVQ